MNQRAIIVAVILFVLIVLGMFAYARMKSDEISKAEPVPLPQPKEQPTGITHIDAKHYFTDGTHTVAGEILMPTPCDLLESEAVIKESAPEQVIIALSIINNTDGVCTQMITPQRFKADFTASADATIDATVNGKPVTLNLVEAGPDENPDDFELYIKG